MKLRAVSVIGGQAPGPQLFQRGAGGRLLGDLLRGAPAAADRSLEKIDGHLVGAGVVGPLGRDDLVAQGLVAVRGLDELLQAPLGVLRVLDAARRAGRSP